MRTGMCLKLAVTIAVAVSATTVLAQGQGRGQGRGFGGGRGGFGNDPSTILSAESVQKELGLTDDQKTQITKFNDDNQQSMMTFFQDLRGASPEERTAKLDARTKENKKKLADILLPPQVDRLNEIYIQFTGAGALSTPEVAEKLKITDEQKKKLGDLATETQQKMGELFQSFGGPPADDAERAERAKKQQKIQTDQKDEAVALLTADQKAQFEKMQGKKFDTSTIQIMGFGNRRGGPGGPGGNRGAGQPGA